MIRVSCPPLFYGDTTSADSAIRGSVFPPSRQALGQRPGYPVSGRYAERGGDVKFPLYLDNVKKQVQVYGI